MSINEQNLSLIQFSAQVWKRNKKNIVVCIGLFILLITNYFLRSYLENGDARIYDYLGQYIYTPDYIQQTPWWALFLPIDRFGGLWVPATSLLTFWLQGFLSPAGTWYFYNALIILFAFIISWEGFHSRVFSFTLAICLGFGTQLYHVYSIPGVVAAIPQIIYYLCLLLTSYKVIWSENRKIFWKATFLISLLASVLGHDGWLNYLVFYWLAGLNLYIYFLRSGQINYRKRLIFIVAVMTVVGILYLFIKSRFSFIAIKTGSEEDMVTNYPSLVIAIEDLISNFFLYFYTVITNFLPPFLVFSNSLYFFGPEKLVEYQMGYHSSHSYLVPMNYYSYWRFFAGIALTIYSYFLVKVIKRTQAGIRDSMILSFFMIMAIIPPLHVFIKFRPYSTFPFLAYKTLVGILGVSLLIAYLLLMVRRDMRNKTLSMIIVLIIWGIILSGALTRPLFLGQMAQIVGINYSQGYPNPLGTLLLSIKSLVH